MDQEVLLTKRKRVPIVKIEADDSDCEIVTNKDDDQSYSPPSKKKKLLKQVKTEKVPRAKTTKRKSPVKRKEKCVKPKIASSKPKDLADLTSVDRKSGLDAFAVEGWHPLDAFKPSTSNSTDTQLEEIASNAVSLAKQSCQPWNDEDVVAATSQVPFEVARNVISLLNQDCTIPFIVRYRKHLTGGLQAEKLREIQESYEEVKTVHKKVETILKTVKHEKFDKNAASALLGAKSLDEVELLYAPFKPGSKKTLAERSKQLGLESVALQLLEGRATLQSLNLHSLVKPTKGLETEKDILSGIQHIIADKISKHRSVLDFIKEKSHDRYIRILAAKSASAVKEDKQAFVLGKTTDNFKYENYYNFNILAKTIAHHQVMALNRGEKQKVLRVKIQYPDHMKPEVIRFIQNIFFPYQQIERETFRFLSACIEDSYDRLIEPYMSRQIRSELSKKAEKESINVFGSNVHKLLLAPPVRGKTVIGIDPGFTHGCKVATVSSNGEVLTTGVIYPCVKGKMNNRENDAATLKSMISNFGAEIIAIGNGTACRETEVWLSNLNTSKYFDPYSVKYCIVNEQGASIYSVTKEAAAEFPDMDPNLRSAVSIARRLQDPLLEYVKIEPKHLGVGMYQHDVPESQLKKALDGIVEECVSFVGVDLNVCPEVMLRKISGLSSSRAKQIVEWRAKNGSFINRQQLLEVKGVGQKSFEQCAGFVKIFPETCTSIGGFTSEVKGKKGLKKTTIDPLDKTIIHPESYEIAKKFLKEICAESSEIGQQSLVNKVNNYMKLTSVESLAQKLNTSPHVMQLIIDAFRQLQDYDIRKEFDQPLFRTSVRGFSDLQVGQELTGRVDNVTSFGAFVDIGVGRNGLIHVSKMKGRKLGVGDRLKVKLLSFDLEKKRLGLELIL